MKQFDSVGGKWAKSWEELEQPSSEVGIICFDADGVTLDIPCGELLGSPGVVINGCQEPSEADRLYGYTQNGHYIILVNAWYASGKRNFPGMSSQKVRASYMLASKGGPFDDGAPIGKLRLCVRNLAEWHRDSALVLTLQNNQGVPFKSLSFDPEKKNPWILLESNLLTIKVIDSYTFPSDISNEMNYKRSCFLDLEFASGQTIDRAIDAAGRVSRFFGLCTGFHASIEAIKFQYVGQSRWVNYYAPLAESSAPSKRTIDQMPFSSGALGSDAGKFLGNWLNSEGSMGDEKDFALFQNASDLIVSLLTFEWKMPIDLEFVAACRAFEALGNYRTDIHSRPKDEHKEHFAELKKRLKGMDDAFVNNVLNMAGRNRKGSRRLSSDLMANYSDLTNWFVPNGDAFVRDQSAARNLFSHASSELTYDYQRLYYLTMGLAMVCYGIIWRMLGMDAERIIACLSQSRFKHDAIEWLQSEYASVEPSR